MPKKKKDNTEWVITKGQLSRWQKEQRKRRQIIIAGSVIISVVLALVIFAVIDSSTNTQSNKTVLKVTGPQDEQTFKMDFYVDMLRLNMRMAADTSDPSSIAISTLQMMASNEIYRQLGKELDITVTEEDIEVKLKEAFFASIDPGTASAESSPEPSYEEQYANLIAGLDANGISEDAYLQEVVAAQILQEKIREHIVNTEVPEEAEQVYIQAIFINAAPEPGTPTSSGTTTTEEKQDPEEIRADIEARLNEGESFNSLAQEYSMFNTGTDTGEFGWLSHKIASMLYGEALAETAFNLEIDTLSDLVPWDDTEENTGYWLVRITDRDNAKPLNEQHKFMLEYEIFDEWFTDQQENNFEVKDDYLDTEDIEWAIRKALS